MMNKLLFVIFASTYAIAVMAGPGHPHDHDDNHESSPHSHDPITQNQADTKARQIVQQLVQKGKIPKSWTTVQQSVKTEKKSFKHGPEWVITLKNDDIADAKKQTLYIFLSLAGDYIAANHTGN